MSAETKPKRKYRKKIIDVNAPRRPTTAFNFFIKMNSAAYIEKHKDLPLNDIIKIISAEWHTLNDEQKKPYNEAAAVAREQYEKELAEYRKSKEYNDFLKLKSDIQKGLIDQSEIDKQQKRRKSSTSNHHSHTTIKAKIPTIKKKFKVDFEVFSDKFKEFNQSRENDLKKLRKIVNNLEEEIEDSEEKIEKLQKEKLQLTSEQKQYLYIQNRSIETSNRWKKVLLSSMSDKQLEQYGLKKDSTINDIIKILTDVSTNSTLINSLKKHISGLKFN